MSISAIVPARNEEGVVARCVESLATQAEIGEIIVVNDESSDGTARVLQELSGRIARLRVIESGGVPEGWVGKNRAAWLGARQVRGEWLLFTDADTVHRAGSAARALEDAERTGSALVSYSPEQELGRWWERALLPFVFCRLAQLYPYHAVSDPQSNVAAANGQYLLIRREAYEAIGTHAAVRSEVLEDVALARRAKRAGHRIHFARGHGIVAARMYRSFGAMWEGWTKNLYTLVGGTRTAAWREVIGVFPVLPVILLAMGAVHLVFPILGGMMLLLRHAAYGVELRRNHYAWSGIGYYLPGAALYCAAVAASAMRHRRGRVAWKGREYRVEGEKAKP
jgi:glycosyltransferase involved in cell wall biosynthesis